MALHFQVSALRVAGPRSAAPGARRDSGVWRLRAGDGGGGRGAGDRRPGTRTLAWAVPPGPEEGAARARGGGWRGRGQARSSPRGGGAAAAAAAPAQVGAGRAGQPARCVAGRGSGVRGHTVGTKLERGPGSARGAAPAGGLEWPARAGLCPRGVARRAPQPPRRGRKRGQARGERADAKDARGGRLACSRAARACASTCSLSTHLESSPLRLRQRAKFRGGGLRHFTMPALADAKMITVRVENDAIELIRGPHGNIDEGQPTRCVARSC